MGSAEAVAVSNCGFRYGKNVALDDVSFRVRPGKIFGVLGPNGSGKTTLFRILATLLRPSSGVARVFGIDVAERPEEVRQLMGVVFQTQSLDSRLTIRENLTHHGHLHGLRGSLLATRIAAALSKVGLASRSEDRVETLSGGLRRRTDLAKILLHNPRLLLLDEPSTGVDPAARGIFWEHLEELRRTDGVTVLLTTHLLEEADRCDELAILDQGRLVRLGRPHALKSEIGGEVVTLQATDASAIATVLTEEFSVDDTRVDRGKIRFEHREGSKWASRLMARFGNRIDSVKISHPSLEDVFLHYTGREFRPAQESATE